MQKITPCLWFDDQAEEAANFKDAEKSEIITKAMLQMKKIDIGGLKAVDKHIPLYDIIYP